MLESFLSRAAPPAAALQQLSGRHTVEDSAPITIPLATLELKRMAIPLPEQPSSSAALA